MPEIVLDDLCKKFGDTVAADHLNLTIAEGEYVCILGPTGAGKTTCMRMICGLTHPESGRVLLDGKDVTMDSPDSRNATMLTQTYALFPHLTVYNNVMFAPKTKGWPEADAKQVVRSTLHMVHLEQKADWIPAELSGGQQQDCDDDHDDQRQHHPQRFVAFLGCHSLTVLPAFRSSPRQGPCRGCPRCPCRRR